MKRTIFTSTLTALLITALSIPGTSSNRFYAHAQEVGADAAPGDLDTSFGDGGKVTINLPGRSVYCAALAMQTDGKIIVVGNASSPEDIVVGRLNTDGLADTTFGNDGFVITDFSNSADSAYAVALQTDGRIVIAGGSYKGSAISEDFALARYNVDGSLDTSFGNGGKVTTDFSGAGDVAFNVVIQTDGKIVAGGSANNPNSHSSDFALARYNANGSLDSSFGSGGKVVTDFFGRFDAITSLAIQPDGKIIGAGYTMKSTAADSIDFALARYDAGGSLDPGFGISGKTTTDFFGFTDNIEAVRLGKNGAIIVAGECFSGHGNDFDNFALARYKANGTLDESFGTDGKVFTDFAGHQDGAFALAIQSDDKIIAAGLSIVGDPSAGNDFALARYTPNGSLDNSFGNAGKVTTDFFGKGDDAYAIALQPDGHLVLAGDAFQPGLPSASAIGIAVARYKVGDIATPGFSLGFEQSPVAGERGTTVKVHVLINRTGGFTGNVTVTPPDTSGLGIKVKPPVDIPTTEDLVTFKLKLKGDASPGPHQLTFIARDDSGRTVSATLTIVIQ